MRKLVIVGLLAIILVGAGAGYGIYESVTQPPPRRSYADADPGASNVHGFALTARAGRF